MKHGFSVGRVLRTLIIGIFLVLFLQNQAVSAAPLSIDKWKPGHYVKIEDWQLDKADQMDDIYQELKDTPALRGVKITVLWSRYETRAGGVSTYDFSTLHTIVNNIKNTTKSGADKHIIFAFPWREFTTDPDEAKLLLPNDLQGTSGLYTAGGPALKHMTFWNLYAYKKSSGNVGGYNLKLYQPALRARIDEFIQALADEFDDDNVLVHVATIESAIGAPVVPYGTGSSAPNNTNLWGTEAKQFDGQSDVLDSMNNHFVKTPVVATLNFTRARVADLTSGGVSSILATGKFGLGGPNSHLGNALNATGNLPGVLTYYPGFSNVLLLAPEVQGDDYESDYGTPPVAYPPYVDIYERLRDDLYANYIVWQRNSPYWLGGSIGGTTIPSVLKFLQTNSDITGDTSNAGGLNTTMPSKLK